ncbi:MAG: TonB-dependent receptor [Prolixibacteraceae bacterium]|jgi:TonB-linked SusC/RagA family outer membrane protein|nr:TonB-dependent receptor [Prolixibacteraceae bacterium]
MKKKLFHAPLLVGWRKKMFRIMRITFILVCCMVFYASASSYSQNTKLSLNTKNSTIVELIRDIESQSKFIFLYQAEDLNLSKRINADFKDATIQEILDVAFKGEGISYEIFDRQILLSKEGASAPGNAMQQARNVSGAVTDKTGQPIPGVSVIVKGTTNGTITDADGKYTLSNVPPNGVLQFSFVGMKTQEVAVANKATINVVMEEETIGIEEVVAIGYGVEKKKNVIGAVTTISNKELTSAPVSMVSNALAGRLPGAIVQQRSGEPGNDNASILIRGEATLGSTKPLIIVDGIPDRDLNSIDPADIESITVLKDASAAIYGARSANGVILVTTKRGTEETTPTFKYEFYQGFSAPTILPKMADATTYAQMYREMQTYKNISENNMAFSLEDIEKYKSGEYTWTHPNTNWFDAMLKKYSEIRHHNFSITGGTKNIKYYTSFGKQYDNGIFKDSGLKYNRYNLRASLDIKINEYLSFNLDINGIQENRLSGTRSAQKVFQSLVKGRPTDPAIFPNGYIAPSIPQGSDTGITGTLAAGYDDNKTYQSQNTLGATLKIPWIEGLAVSGYYAYDMYFEVDKIFQKPWTNYNLNKSAYYAAGNTGKEDGTAFLIPQKMSYSEPQLRDSYSDSKSATANIKIDYEKTIKGKHNVKAFVAYETFDYIDKGINAFRKHFVSDALPYLFAGSTTDQTIGSSVSIDARENYFGRLSYSYDERYLFQFSFRRDGSIKFSKESGRWGNFPSLLAGWRISSEDFWKNNIKFIDYFKIRASWGQMGNDAVPAFQYLSTYGFTTGMVLGSNKSYNAGLIQNSVPNPLITWEVANIFNIGVETKLLKNKLGLNFDYFYQRRNNILVARNASVPDFTGLSLPDENYGIVDNQGLEAELIFTDKIGDFSFAANANLAFARNKVIEFDEPKKNVPWQVQTGHPMGSKLLYIYDGIFRDEEQIAFLPHVSGTRPGDIIIRDYNNDKIINNDDRILFDKTVNPEITYGISFSIGYKNWLFSGLVQGVGYCMRDMYLQLQGSEGNYFMYDAIDRWTPDNIDASKPRAWEREEPYWRVNYKSDYTFHNGAYARMKNLQLSYTIPNRISKAILVKNAELYISGQNLFLIYSGNKIMDPELGNSYNYPLMKVYSVGVKVSF